MPTTVWKGKTMRKILTLTAVLLLGIPHAALPQDAPTEATAVSQFTRRAVVTIRVYGPEGRQVALGSGFIVPDGRIVTNAHVVAGAARLEVFDWQGNLLGTTQYAEAVSATTDLAILPRLSAVPGMLPLSDEEPQVGARVFVIGSPRGLTNTVSGGLISAVRSVNGSTILQISAPISAGSSGGPVINRQGEVVGVAVARLREGQNLNFAVPAKYVRALIESPPGRVMLVEITTASSASARTTTADAPALPNISLGESSTGALTRSDYQSDDGSYVDVYAFEAEESRRVTAALSSEEFDTYLTVARVNGETLDFVASNDDKSIGTDSRLTFTLQEDTDYVIAVTSYGEVPSFGAYTLSLRPARGQAVDGRQTDRWRRVARTDDYVLGFDRRSMYAVRSGVYRVWMRWSYFQPQTDDDGDTYDLAKYELEVDCRRRRMRFIRFIQYLDGETVWSSDNDIGSWDSWVPGSVGEHLGMTICEYARRNGI